MKHRRTGTARINLAEWHATQTLPGFVHELSIFELTLQSVVAQNAINRRTHVAIRENA